MRREQTTPEQVLVLATLGLVALGTVMVYSATSGLASDPLFYLERNVAYALLGLAGMWLMARLDYRRLAASAPVLVLISGGLLLFVVAAGVTAKGEQRWLPLPGGFTLQPSELAKVAICIFAAAMLARRTRPPSTWREVMQPVGAATAVICGLIVVSDLGSALAVAFGGMAVLIAAGAAGGALARISLAALALVGLSIWHKPYRGERLMAFLQPSDSSLSAGYQIHQAGIAIGSGGVFGRGIGESVQKLAYLPEVRTDMILGIIGEELGLVGMLATFAGFAAIAWAGYTISLRSNERFGKLLSAGLTTLICGQAVLNAGGVLGVLPLTGVPLPFISYGGTSLIALLSAVGLVLSVGAYGRSAERSVRVTARVVDAVAAPTPARRVRAAGARRR